MDVEVVVGVVATVTVVVVGAPCEADGLLFLIPRPLFLDEDEGALTGDCTGESGRGLFTTDLGILIGESSVMKLTSPIWSSMTSSLGGGTITCRGGGTGVELRLEGAAVTEGVHTGAVAVLSVLK